MAEVLYRKHRPKKFSEIVGQDYIITTLKNALKAKSVAHAYLFAGPRGVGKTTIARILAKAVNCNSLKNQEPCGTCASCKSFDQGKSMDLVEIDAASNRGIDEIRELRAKVRFAPSNSKYKVYIIDEVHMLTKEAFNALLKTLEEPPAHAIFILATTEIHKLPATVISRCQRFDFKKMTVDELVSNLKSIIKKEGIVAEKGVLEFIAREADGGARDSISLLGQATAFSDKEITLEDILKVIGITDINLIFEFAKDLAKKDGRAALQKIQDITDKGVNLEQFIKSLIQFFRQSLVFSIRLEGEEEEKINWIKNNFSKTEIRKIIERLQVAYREQKDSVHVQLPLELAVVDLCVDQPESIDKKIDLPKKETDDKPKPSKIFKVVDKLAVKKEKVDDSEKLKLVKENWSKIIENIETSNFTLGSLARMGKLSCGENGCVVLGFSFKFHGDQINTLKNRKLIESSIEKVCNEKIKIQGICAPEDASNSSISSAVMEKQQAPKKEEEQEKVPEMVNDAINMFGGKLID